MLYNGEKMKDILKNIRTHMNMSQTEFAEKLGVSFATVNRWENGRAVPNKLAQLNVYSLCKNNKVPVYEMMLKRIDDISSVVETEGSRVLLYHGSKAGIEGSIAPKSRRQCDFGSGFYMGTYPAQVLTLVCDFDESKFYIVSVDISGLEVLNVPADLDWAMLVAYHRGRMDKIKGTAFYDKYESMTKGKDLVVGSIADDRMFYVIDNFFLGNITDAALINSLSALELGKQYVAVSDKACNNIRIERDVEISYLERFALKDAAEANRNKGISMANEICKEYRREGIYFDELLDKAIKEV